MNISDLTSQQLRRAAEIRENIEALQNELGNLIGSSGSAAPVETTIAPKRGGMSAAGRARIAAAARARWARVRAANGKPEEKPKRRTMSAAAKARLASIARARWKKAKAAGRSAL